MHQALEAKLLQGDCLSHLKEMPNDDFQLIYLDPPFFTQRTHTLKPRDRSRTYTFDDLWSTQESYRSFILARLEHLHRVLSPTGSIFFHCDRNATHFARAALDVVFGEGNFRAEIIWYYRRWSNAAKGLLPAHQTLLYYTKSNDFIFNHEYEDYSPSTNVDQILQ